jgi:hypothetical protein
MMRDAGERSAVESGAARGSQVDWSNIGGISPR